LQIRISDLDDTLPINSPPQGYLSVGVAVQRIEEEYEEVQAA
jgi:hypothetical protein